MSSISGNHEINRKRLRQNEDTSLRSSPKKFKRVDGNALPTNIVDHIFYHGTSKSHAERIRKKGFSVKKQKSGCTEKLTQIGRSDENSKQYCYLTKDPMEAAKYAKMHGPQNGEIVPIVVPPELSKKLLRDPEAGTNTAYRCSDTISAKLVLPKRKKGLTERKIQQLLRSSEEWKLDHRQKENLPKILGNYVSKALEKKIEQAPDFIQEELSYATELSEAVSLKLGQTMTLTADELEALGLF